MSLPSINRILKKRGITRPKGEEDAIEILEEAFLLDFAPAIEFLQKKSHEAEKDPNGRAMWEEDPKSPIGQLLLRMHASDPLRILTQKHCHGMPLTFINCCKGWVGRPPENIFTLQVMGQSGQLDC